MRQLNDQMTACLDAVSAMVEENTASTEQMAANSGEVAQAIESIASVREENSAAVAGRDGPGAASRGSALPAFRRIRRWPRSAAGPEARQGTGGPAENRHVRGHRGADTAG